MNTYNRKSYDSFRTQQPYNIILVKEKKNEVGIARAQCRKVIDESKVDITSLLNPFTMKIM